MGRGSESPQDPSTDSRNQSLREDQTAEVACRIHAVSGYGNIRNPHKLRGIVAAEHDEVIFSNSGDWHSAFDRNYTFETIEDAALSVSQIVEQPVFFATLYDDDIFMFGVCREGRRDTRQIQIGFFASRAYGIKREAADAKAFCQQ